MRSELAQPGMQFVSRDGYNQLFTMHGSTMIYLFVDAARAGARRSTSCRCRSARAEIAAPRVALAGFWLFAARRAA